MFTQHLVRNTALQGCLGVLKLCCSLQVLRSGAVGDRHAGGAALPGHDQRAGAALRHGRGAAGKARQLSRHAVSATAALRAQLVPPDPCRVCSWQLPGMGLGEGDSRGRGCSVSVTPVFYGRETFQKTTLLVARISPWGISSNKQTKSKLCVTE